MNNDNGAGFRFEWWLGAGSSYSGGAVPTAWEARADGDRGVSTLAINDNTANDWAITGIQVEVGEFTSATLPPFQFEDTGDNLARCQRYLQLVAEGNSITVGAAGMYTASNMNCIVDLKAVMRTTPSVDQVSGTDYFSFQRDGANDTFNTLTIADSSDRAVRLYNNGQISGTQGDFGVVITNNSSTKLRLDAEL
jgi:hypothetical protein